jgi:hypothetical protein
MKEAADQLIHGGDRIGAVLRAHGGVHLCGGHISPIFYSSRASTWHKPLILFGVG